MSFDLLCSGVHSITNVGCLLGEVLPPQVLPHVLVGRNPGQVPGDKPESRRDGGERSWALVWVVETVVGTEALKMIAVNLFHPNKVNNITPVDIHGDSSFWLCSGLK